MPRFAANVSFMFTELPFLERFGAAASAGFGAVEFHFPYDFDPQDVRATLDDHKLVPVLINIRGGDAKLGERGFAGLPGREDTFRLYVAEAVAYAKAIGVRQLNCLGCVQPPGADASACETTLVDNLRYAAGEAALADMIVNLEPINTQDVPGYLVSNTTDAIRIMDAVVAGALAKPSQTQKDDPQDAA